MEAPGKVEKAQVWAEIAVGLPKAPKTPIRNVQVLDSQNKQSKQNKKQKQKPIFFETGKNVQLKLYKLKYQQQQY